VNPVHTLPLYFLRIQFNIVLPSTLWSSEEEEEEEKRWWQCVTAVVIVAAAAAAVVEVAVQIISVSEFTLYRMHRMFHNQSAIY
jgi:hypothetical protein